MASLSSIIESSRSIFAEVGLAPKSGLAIEKSHIASIVSDPRVKVEEFSANKNGVNVTLIGLFFNESFLAAEMTQESAQGKRDIDVPASQYEKMKSFFN